MPDGQDSGETTGDPQRSKILWEKQIDASVYRMFLKLCKKRNAYISSCLDLIEKQKNVQKISRVYILGFLQAQKQRS